MKKIALLGSTGSIGTQTLEVAREKGYRITALAARQSVAALEAQIREFSPEYCAVSDEAAARRQLDTIGHAVDEQRQIQKRNIAGSQHHDH